MDKNYLARKARQHVETLCIRIPDRRVGSEGNRVATEYVDGEFRRAGWRTEVSPLQVVDWATGGASLRCGEEDFEVFSSHYSLGCEATGQLVATDTLERLASLDIRDRIVLLHGAIASGQIVPKGYLFYSVPEHEQLIGILERGAPAALVCATGRDPATAGGVYPFPLFEDGNFDIPSVYMTDTEGARLLSHEGSTAMVVSAARRIPATAFNVIAHRNGGGEGRIVVSAHVDAKIGTPGAIDNATGVAVLLLLAEMLHSYEGPRRIELAAFNGEDYYSAPGQALYLEQNRGRFADIVLNINIDGVGLKEGPSCLSAFSLPPAVCAVMYRVTAGSDRIVEGPLWYQGDHSMFLQQGCPAIAVSSFEFVDNIASQQITHTPADNPGIVSYRRVAECATAIMEIIEAI